MIGAGSDGGPPEPTQGGRRWAWVAVTLALVFGLAAVAASSSLFRDDPSTSTPSPTASHEARPTPSVDRAVRRDVAVASLLDERAAAVLAQDHAAFLAGVDPQAEEFGAAQAQLIGRLDAVEFADWAYEVLGPGPELTPAQAAGYPRGAAIVKVRLSYRLAGTETRTDREQYLTVVPRGDDWFVASDTDGQPSGQRTERDLWDLGAVRLVHGETSTVLASAGSEGAARRLARRADDAVAQVEAVWPGDWSGHPVVVLPRTQADMATVLGHAMDGLGQVAAVTTGMFGDGRPRGDRVVVNPEAFGTLTPLGRQVVLTHEVTHVATRFTTTDAPPVWLSEGFADYVAYKEAPVQTAVVAGDLLDEVRKDGVPDELPGDGDFDTGRGDVAVAYEGAWLACRLIARNYGEDVLVAFYRAMSDGQGAGWPEESAAVLGATRAELTESWQRYLTRLAS